MQSLIGQVAIVAAADTELGASTAKLFVARGAQVMLAGREPAKGEKLSKSLGSTTRFVGADLAVEGDVRWMVESTLKQFGQLDYFFYDSEATISADSSAGGSNYESGFARYLKSLLFCYRYVPAVMLRQGRGSIVHVNQLVNVGIGEPAIARSIARAAFQDFIRLVAADFREHSVRVNSISLRLSAAAHVAEPTVQSAISPRCARIDRGSSARYGLIERAAQAAVFLASDDARLLTGYDMVVTEATLASTAIVPERGAFA